jgi:glycosyltransferase involved in cell wall biosynthesis
MRIAVIMDMVAPYATPTFGRLAERDDCELLVVFETLMESDRRWVAERDLPYEHVVLQSRTIDLSRLSVGTGVRTRFDTYLYIPRRPLDPLRRFSPDAVIAAGGGIWSSPSNIAALLARRSWGWGLVPWWGSFPRPRPSLPRRLAEPWVRAFMRFADAWMAYGSRSERDLLRLGADPRRTVIAPLVPNVPDVSPTERSAAVPRQPPLFLFVGRLIERKGVDLLLRAFAELEDGELWIVGDGPVRPQIEAAAARDPRVRLLGYLEEEPLHELYAQATAMVVPSWYEVWGLVVHEALAHGVPVIATDQVGATDDLVDPGVNGLIVPAGSVEQLVHAMRAVASWTEAERERCRRRCREKLADWTVERAADAFVQASSLAVEHRRTTASG